MNLINQAFICQEVIAERQQQDEKWGYDRVLSSYSRLAVLMEEVGEAARACLERDYPNLREELVQVAACAVAWVEQMDAQNETLLGNLRDSQHDKAF